LIAIFSYLAKDLFKNPEFKGNIFLSFSADEESGNFTGIRKILKYIPKADVCILGYQGREEISIGGRGFLRFKLITFGESAHTGSRNKKGINAIHRMQKAMEAILKANFLKQKEKFFEYGSNLNFSLIKGGTAINIVPDKCEAMVDVRILPFQKPEKVLKEIYQKLKEIKKSNKNFIFKIEVLQKQDAFLIDYNNPFLKILKENTEKILKGKIPFKTSGAGSVGNLIAKRKVPIINGFGCQCENAHAPNEWVNIRDLPKIYSIYKNSLIKFSKL